MSPLIAWLYDQCITCWAKELQFLFLLHMSSKRDEGERKCLIPVCDLNESGDLTRMIWIMARTRYHKIMGTIDSRGRTEQVWW